jgi:hypothetical protein
MLPSAESVAEAPGSHTSDVEEEDLHAAYEVPWDTVTMLSESSIPAKSRGGKHGGHTISCGRIHKALTLRF